jgi:hypothetical protein
LRAKIAPNFNAQRRTVFVGDIDATLGEHILDVAVAQSEAEKESESLLNDDTRKAVAAVGKLIHRRTLCVPSVPSQRVNVTVPETGRGQTAQATAPPIAVAMAAQLT